MCVAWTSYTCTAYSGLASTLPAVRQCRCAFHIPVPSMHTGSIGPCQIQRYHRPSTTKPESCLSDSHCAIWTPYHRLSKPHSSAKVMAA